MSGVKCYEVMLTATATRTIQVAAYDDEEAVEKAMDVFGTGSVYDYEFDDVELYDVNQSDPDS